MLANGQKNKILLPVVFLFRRYSSHSSISASIGKQHMFYSIAVVNKENKERLHLRVQQTCKFCETKESIYLRKEFKYLQVTVL